MQEALGNATSLHWGYQSWTLRTVDSVIDRLDWNKPRLMNLGVSTLSFGRTSYVQVRLGVNQVPPSTLTYLNG
jgi:hypothetical protein